MSSKFLWTFDFSLLATSLAAAGYAVFLVWRKIPLLLQVPSELIDESFVTRPSRIKHYLGPVFDFFQRKKYRDLYFEIAVKSLRCVRVWLLRLERVTFRMLERLEERSRQWSAQKAEFWSELKQWKREARESGGAAIPKAVLHSETPPLIGGTKRPRRRKEKTQAV